MCSWLDLPSRPGFGVTLNREKMHLRRPYSHSIPKQVADKAAAASAKDGAAAGAAAGAGAKGKEEHKETKEEAKKA